MEALAKMASEICSPEKKNGDGSQCLVCHEAEVFHSLNCGHGLCLPCWEGTLSHRLDGGSGNAFETACPMKVHSLRRLSETQQILMSESVLISDAC